MEEHMKDEAHYTSVDMTIFVMHIVKWFERKIYSILNTLERKTIISYKMA